MTQEIENYKLNWLTEKCFRVIVKDMADADKAKTWLKETLHERSYDFSFNPENSVHTFIFELAQDAKSLREELYGDDRTVDVS
jgi:hypothetical protein